MSETWKQKTLINELTQGKELANQLKNHLDLIESRKTCESLVEKILSSYEKALSIMDLRSLMAEGMEFVGNLDSPDSNVGNSPWSEESKDHYYQSKRRKTLPKWSEQVSVCLETGLEGPKDDGFSWRKYGQKDILKAKFPRSYYRCTHRNSQGCLATKQVQRSDKDPSIFEVSYRGRHTCIQSPLGKQVAKQEKGEENKEELLQLPKNLSFNFGDGLKVETEELGEEILPSFFFPSTPIEPENMDSSRFFTEENKFMGGFSPPFVSPTTSELEFDFTEMISGKSSVLNSPIGILDFPFDQLNFDPDFSLDTSEFLL